VLKARHSQTQRNEALTLAHAQTIHSSTRVLPGQVSHPPAALVANAYIEAQAHIDTFN